MHDDVLVGVQALVSAPQLFRPLKGSDCGLCPRFFYSYNYGGAHIVRPCSSMMGLQHEM